MMIVAELKVPPGLVPNEASVGFRGRKDEKGFLVLNKMIIL